MTPDEREHELNPIAAEHYGSKTAAVEPGGVEIIPDSERHGRPGQLLWTWSSPNLEFATIGVGILGPLFFGLTFAQSVAAIVVGTALGSLTHGILSTWGPPSGLCQMVLSRVGFGYRGNILPAGINAVIAGIGWFAVNSISGALALHVLIPALPHWVCLVIIVIAQIGIAFYGHNLVQAFERYAGPILAVIFVIGAIVIFTKFDPGAARIDPGFPLPTSGGFLIEAAAAFGYACGWNPYASDYTRYLPKSSPRPSVGWSAALGVFVSCIVLESAGAAMVSAAGKSADVLPGVYTGLMPTWLGDLTLLSIAVGAVCANVLNIYSGAMSCLALGIRLPVRRARAIVACVFGVLGFILALYAIENPGVNYENFLLIIAYWIGPWLGVVIADRWQRRGQDVTRLALNDHFKNPRGMVAMGLGMIISIWGFSNQTKYVGYVVKHHPALGDITFLVGFVVAAGIYLGLTTLMPERNHHAPTVPDAA
ncbi:MAG TPA: cytosine permease [Nocardioidaceae bacterium]|nr:cytosine permease [Nocardioidaceae bacterium]